MIISQEQKVLVVVSLMLAIVVFTATMLNQVQAQGLPQTRDALTAIPITGEMTSATGLPVLHPDAIWGPSANAVSGKNETLESYLLGYTNQYIAWPALPNDCKTDCPLWPLTLQANGSVKYYDILQDYYDKTASDARYRKLLTKLTNQDMMSGYRLAPTPGAGDTWEPLQTEITHFLGVDRNGSLDYAVPPGGGSSGFDADTFKALEDAVTGDEDNINALQIAVGGLTNVTRDLHTRETVTGWGPVTENGAQGGIAVHVGSASLEVAQAATYSAPTVTFTERDNNDQLVRIPLTANSSAYRIRMTSSQYGTATLTLNHWDLTHGTDDNWQYFWSLDPIGSHVNKLELQTTEHPAASGSTQFDGDPTQVERWALNTNQEVKIPPSAIAAGDAQMQSDWRNTIGAGSAVDVATNTSKISDNETAIRSIVAGTEGMDSISRPLNDVTVAAQTSYVESHIPGAVIPAGTYLVEYDGDSTDTRVALELRDRDGNLLLSIGRWNYEHLHRTLYLDLPDNLEQPLVVRWERTGAINTAITVTNQVLSFHQIGVAGALADGVITTEKLEEGAVTHSKLAPGVLEDVEYDTPLTVTSGETALPLPDTETWVGRTRGQTQAVTSFDLPDDIAAGEPMRLDFTLATHAPNANAIIPDILEFSLPEDLVAQPHNLIVIINNESENTTPQAPIAWTYSLNIKAFKDVGASDKIFLRFRQLRNQQHSFTLPVGTTASVSLARYTEVEHWALTNSTDRIPAGRVYAGDHQVLMRWRTMSGITLNLGDPVELNWDPGGYYWADSSQRRGVDVLGGPQHQVDGIVVHKDSGHADILTFGGYSTGIGGHWSNLSVGDPVCYTHTKVRISRDKDHLGSSSDATSYWIGHGRTGVKADGSLLDWDPSTDGIQPADCDERGEYYGIMLSNGHQSFTPIKWFFHH